MSYWDSSGNKAVVPLSPLAPTIPSMVYLAYQGMFFIITPALICGAFAERMKFSTMCVFMLLWGTLDLLPARALGLVGEGSLCRRAAQGVRLRRRDGRAHQFGDVGPGVRLVLGKRLGYGQEPMPPHNLTYTCIGAGLLWVGWFGFNAGSAVAANGSAANAFLVDAPGSQHGTARLGVCRMDHARKTERARCLLGCRCRPGRHHSGAADSSRLCRASSSGLCAGFVCFLACTTLKAQVQLRRLARRLRRPRRRRDPGLPADRRVCDEGCSRNVPGPGAGSKATFSNSSTRRRAPEPPLCSPVVGTFIFLKVLDAVMGLRVSQSDEIQGLDLSQHGEEGYIFF